MSSFVPLYAMQQRGATARATCSSLCIHSAWPRWMIGAAAGWIVPRDVRAVLRLTLRGRDSDAAPVTARYSGGGATRIRRQKPFLSRTRADAVAHAAPPQVGAACGVVSFLPNGDTTYYVYYLPTTSGGGAGLHFRGRCTAHNRSCVLQRCHGRRLWRRPSPHLAP